MSGEIRRSRKDQALIPTIRRLIEVGALGIDQAESLTGGCFHNDPAMNIVDAFCTQAFQARDLGFNIVGFDI